MNEREKRNLENETLAYEAVTHLDNWISAVQLTMRIGLPKQARTIAYALIRLEEQGKIEKATFKVPSKWRSTGDDVTHYRIPGVSVGLFASWFKPQVPKFEKQRLSVRVVRMK